MAGVLDHDLLPVHLASLHQAQRLDSDMLPDTTSAADGHDDDLLPAYLGQISWRLCGRQCRVRQKLTSNLK